MPHVIGWKSTGISSYHQTHECVGDCGLVLWAPVFSQPEAADAVLAAMRAHPLGRPAECIGNVVADPYRFVQMITTLSGRRMVDWLSS